MASTYANRGMTLENLVEYASEQYAKADIAYIDKIPTPVKVLKNQGFKIIGYWEKKSTVDFIGILNGGQYICFDAKATQQKSLPYKNVHQHQEEYMKRIKSAGGQAFFIVGFMKLDRYFRIDIGQYLSFRDSTDRKSIPLNYFEEECQEVFKTRKAVIDYLNGIERREDN